MKQFIYTRLTRLAMILIISTAAQAQEFKTDESPGKQLKNNKLAGLQYKSESLPVQSSQLKDRQEGKESLIAQIRKGIAANMQFAKGSNAGKVTNPATHTAKTTGSKNVALPSGSTAAKEKKAVVIITKPPLQEEGEKKSTNAHQ